MMIRGVLIALAVIATSFYFFPFSFQFLPEVNTKMMLAAVGLVIYLIRLGQQRGASVNKDMFFFVAVCGFSLFGRFFFNNLQQYSGLCVCYILGVDVGMDWRRICGCPVNKFDSWTIINKVDMQLSDGCVRGSMCISFVS